MTMIKMLRALMEKVDNIQEHMGNVSREMEILRENQKEMLEVKISVTEKKNTFDGLFSRLDWLRKESPSLRICQ